MSLEFAILGFLNDQPFTGYDLKKMFDTSVRHFWAADQSQIYRTLGRLNAAGLTEIEHVAQTDRPDRKVYHITPAGREAFQKWLAGPFPEQAPHSGPLVQVFFSAGLDDEAVLARFQQAAQIFRTLLGRYEQVPVQAVETFQAVPSERDHYFWMLTLDLGKRTQRAQLEWAETVIADLQAGRVPSR